MPSIWAAIFIYGAPIAAMFLYGNTVSIMKKVKNGEDTDRNTTVGRVLSGFIIYAFIALLTALQ